MRWLALTFIITSSVLTFGCVAHPYKVPTAAMIPTINIGDGIVANEAYYKLYPIERFDIVTFKSPPMDFSNNERQTFVMRIIGLGEEKVELRKGIVFINDVQLNEPFEKIPSDDDFPPIVVPKDEYFILGDNRPNSWDSRYWKPATIKKSDIYGKVETILPGRYKDAEQKN